PLHKSGGPLAFDHRRVHTHVPDGRPPRRLLRSCRKRPGDRAAEQRHELAPSQLIGSHSFPSHSTALSLLRNERLARRSNTGDLNDHLTVLRPREMRSSWRLRVECPRRIRPELALIPFVATAEVERP